MIRPVRVSKQANGLVRSVSSKGKSMAFGEFTRIGHRNYNVARAGSAMGSLLSRQVLHRGYHQQRFLTQLFGFVILEQQDL